jgi:hypothetical protein
MSRLSSNTNVHNIVKHVLSLIKVDRPLILTPLLMVCARALVNAKAKLDGHEK